MKKKKEKLLDHIKKYHFELKHLLIVFVILVLSQMLTTYIHKMSLRDFLLETRRWYQRDFVNSLANMSATSLELLLEVANEATVKEVEKRQIIQAFNIVLSQQLLQPHVEEVVLLLESGGTVNPVDDGQNLYTFLFQDDKNIEYVNHHSAAMKMYIQEKENIRKTEQIVTVTEGSQTFHVFVPFVLRGEYSGVFYMKAKPAFGFVTSEILTSYNQTSIIFTALILFGFLGMFYISSYTVSERDEAQRMLFQERESKLKKEITYKKEALFTKRIYHTHHKAEKVMGYIKEDLRKLTDDNFTDTKYRVIKYANFISRVIYDMKWYDPPIQTIRNSIFSTDLNEVVKFLVDNLFKRISRDSDQFVFNLDFDENLPPVQVNEFVIWEILEPLIQNCIDHSNKEQVIIDISTYYDHEKNESILMVEDNGVGIENSLLKQEKDNPQVLFKENVSTKHDYHKKGYGCYIAYELARERCGWDIIAENKDNGGARFIIKIKNV